VAVIAASALGFGIAACGTGSTAADTSGAPPL